MQAKAVARYIRIAPRKVRLVVDLVRGKKVSEAFALLQYTPKAAAPIVEKVLKSAMANAEHNFDMDVNSLYITEAYVDQGPTLKRFRPRSQGRAYSIMKRTSHITLVVGEKNK
ncbi:50S ribosomal protein L22 [Fodinisporobacter ferrooxydans]|uniref:Large ribosomal subunit protein uL22 n=1 Tax=Fodinisporobacter ferrooxydans TaxID=2901836 RepID=A0ABY4CNJ4_9BACL|nr:50S ribosomal protein L22 [Alicyclobacillaceae bacterium MYW30-H2]